MSRGPGKVETAVLEGVRRLSSPSTAALACYVYDLTDEAELTLAQLGSVQRALRRLKARGEVVEHIPPRSSTWRLAPARRRNTPSASR